jgi:tetratricopeptide (TPR) repeat protein
MYQLKDFVNCIENCIKAASLNRGSELHVIFESLSWEFFLAGFPDKQKYYNLEAFQLNGDSVLYFNTLSAYETDPDKSMELLQKAYAIDTTNSGIAYELGIGYMFLNQPKNSLKYYKKFFEIIKTVGSGTNLDVGRMGWAYWENGYKQEAEYYFEKQLEYCKNDIKLKRPWGQTLNPYYDMAGIYAFRGDKEKAYECLKKFNKKQIMPYYAVAYIKTDPLFNSIRNEPEFQQIARDIEAKYQAEHERVRKWLEAQGML